MAAAVTTSRVEAFSDGVMAIIITIMVLELDVPEEPTFHALGHSATGLLTYLLSFVYVGIYWNNHHHFFHLVKHVRGGVLWANLALLFCLSLLPFTTAWMDESGLASPPTMVYGMNLLACALAWFVMQIAVFHVEGRDSVVRRAVGSDAKGRISPVLYVAGIATAAAFPWIAVAIYTVVAIMWLVPDRRFERAAAAAAEPQPGQ
jgi:uncharacterized membrane protein